MIRLAALNDLPAIVAIYNQSVPGRLATADMEPVTVADRLEWFQKHIYPNRPLWVYETQQQVIGWCSFQDFYGRKAYEKTVEISIYIDYNFHHQHIAKNLFEQAASHASQNQIKTILAFVFKHNTPSITFFTKMGFGEWGFLPGIAEMDGVEIGLSILGLRLI